MYSLNFGQEQAVAGARGYIDDLEEEIKRLNEEIDKRNQQIEEQERLIAELELQAQGGGGY